MVSFHTPLSPNRRKIVPELENLLMKRRKLSGEVDDHGDQLDDRGSNHAQMMMKSTLDTELHLETRIPLEWQRCLDIKSGQIYFYNTRTNKRMLSDSRSSPEPPPLPPPPPQPPSHGHMSLDLELNLPCGSSSSSSTIKNQVPDHNIITKPNSGRTPSNSSPSGGDHNSSNPCKNNNRGTGLSRAPSWLSFEGGVDQEMMAAACKKCHMLVMMCKSSPSCPNCKFLHPPPPPEQSTTTSTTSTTTTPNLLKRRLSLLC